MVDALEAKRDEARRRAVRLDASFWLAVGRVLCLVSVFTLVGCCDRSRRVCCECACVWSYLLRLFGGDIDGQNEVLVLLVGDNSGAEEGRPAATAAAAVATARGPAQS